MAKTVTILLIEGKRVSKQLSFEMPLRKRYEVIVANNGQQALSLLQMILPDVIVLNAASMRTSGYRICHAIRQEQSELPIILIQAAEKSKQKRRQKSVLKQSGGYADVALVLPFTARKLVNRIQRFITAKDGEILATGPFRINLKNRVLITQNTEIRLTPKLAALLELFMRNPGKILERSFLMEQVWQTDYMGDTRTLDVHIRWIREAIEQNPGRPVYLRTIRGKGYMLDLSNT